METFLHDQPAEAAATTVRYGGFWIRSGAAFLDGLLILFITLPLNYFNVTRWKSSLLFVLLALLSLLYKPYMEYKFGATLGKMALKLRVTGPHFEKADFKAVALRNLVYFTISFVTQIGSLLVYLRPEFARMTSYRDYNSLVAQSPGLMFMNAFLFGFFLVDVIALLADKRKRSVHDRMGSTFVIEE